MEDSMAVVSSPDPRSMLGTKQSELYGCGSKWSHSVSLVLDCCTISGVSVVLTSVYTCSFPPRVSVQQFHSGLAHLYGEIFRGSKIPFFFFKIIFQSRGLRSFCSFSHPSFPRCAVKAKVFPSHWYPEIAFLLCQHDLISCSLSLSALRQSRHFWHPAEKHCPECTHQLSAYM